MLNLKTLRAESGLSLRELSQKLNFSYSSLGKYERNEQEPNLETIIKIADYFDVTVDYLIGRSLFRNPSKEVVGLKLHLSEEAVGNLEIFSHSPSSKVDLTYASILSQMLSHPKFISILAQTFAYILVSDDDWSQSSAELNSKLKNIVEKELTDFSFIESFKENQLSNIYSLLGNILKDIRDSYQNSKTL